MDCLRPTVLFWLQSLPVLGLELHLSLLEPLFWRGLLEGYQGYGVFVKLQTLPHSEEQQEAQFLSCWTCVPMLPGGKWISSCKTNLEGTSLVIHWLRFWASSARWGTGSIPDQGTKIPCATRHGDMAKKRKNLPEALAVHQLQYKYVGETKMGLTC